MKNWFCERCFKYSKHLEKHHKFSNTKSNRKIYGKLIDELFNIQYLCYDCHHNKPVDKYSEREFREEAMRQHYILPKGSKSYQLKWGNK